jgi:hypothetical protein
MLTELDNRILKKLQSSGESTHIHTVHALYQVTLRNKMLKKLTEFPSTVDYILLKTILNGLLKSGVSNR